MSSPTQFPLREKRKAATRRSLIKSAQALFATQGYENTTLEAIAEHAGLHVQTLYRHFSNKLELAAAGGEDFLDRFREAITDPQRTDTTFEFWREWVRSTTTEITKNDGGRQYREFLLQLFGPPTISSQIIRIAQQYQDLLTESLAKDFDEPAEALGTARLVAIMLWGANAHVLRLHATQADYDLVAGVVEVIDSVEKHFRHLLR
ncbi:MAG: TetR/AcrR family transcriptional regulator [Gammaproteobacteria bacterium]|nr:TetR/AcrR family transcriptional regulator [Gammaproteobacteria bacterium]